MGKNRYRPSAEEQDSIARSIWQAHKARLDDLWNVPERAKEAYLEMEDDFSPRTVLDFMLAMHPEES